ncbi:MAG: hypothetical protein ACKVJE_17495 [Pseudomonadales bacterium]
MSGGGDNEIKDTQQQKDLAYVAAEGWNFSQEELAPLQEKYMEKVDSMADPSRKEFIAGRANLGQQAATSEAVSDVATGASSHGLDLNSGKVKGALTDIATGAGKTGGQVASQGKFEQDTQHIKGMQSIVDMGSGQKTQAVAGLSDIASIAGANARSDAVDSFNERSSNLQAVGTVLGAGTRYAMKSSAPTTAAGLRLEDGAGAMVNNGNNWDSF